MGTGQLEIGLCQQCDIEESGVFMSYNGKSNGYLRTIPTLVINKGRFATSRVKVLLACKRSLPTVDCRSLAAKLRLVRKVPLNFPGPGPPA